MASLASSNGGDGAPPSSAVQTGGNRYIALHLAIHQTNAAGCSFFDGVTGRIGMARSAEIRVAQEVLKLS